MALTDIQVKALQPKEKQYKVFDGGGLYVLVHPNGSKYWRLKYRFNGIENVYSIGIYPDIKLPKARQQREIVKAKIVNNINPTTDKQIQGDKEAGKHSFEAMAKEWHDIKKRKWSERHAKDVLHSLEKDIFPHIGRKDIKEITRTDIIKVLERIEARGALIILSKLKQRSSAIFNYAISKEIGLENNPVTNFGDRFETNQVKHFNRLDKKDLPEFLNKLDNYQGEITTIMGLKIALLTFARTDEIRFAPWSEIDFNNNLWTIPAQRMKMKRDHIIPLSRQAVAILKELHKFTGEYKYIFASYHKPHKQPMSENAMLFGLYRMGYKGKATVHGMRATASTILNSEGVNSDWIEKQLAHEHSDKIRATYNHADYLPERRKMMQSWANLLDSLKAGNVVPIDINQNK